MGDVLDAFSPNLLVEGRVKADVRGSHVLIGKLFDGLDGGRRALLERFFVEVLVQMDRVLPGDNVSDGGPLSSLLNLFVDHSVVGDCRGGLLVPSTSFTTSASQDQRNPLRMTSMDGCNADSSWSH